LTALQDSNIISATGKLVCELNTHKTFVPPNSDEPTQPSVTENEEGIKYFLKSKYNLIIFKIKIFL
jgi:hypothetical protein